MKLDENKHDHKLTNWLKVGIFALLMLAPMFASISQTLYVTFNKNAYQSYSGTNTQPIEYIETEFDNLQINATYQSYFDTEVPSVTGVIINAGNVKNITNNTEYPTVNRLMFYKTNVPYIVGYSDTNTYYWNNNTIQFTYAGTTQTGNATDYVTFMKLKYNDNYNLDNAFYYGVEKMTESDLFNWTQNTALYTGINAMTTQLEIQTPAIAILLTYWFILTIIYVIIDIVLKGFTLLTHMFSNKV